MVFWREHLNCDKYSCGNEINTQVVGESWDFITESRTSEGDDLKNGCLNAVLLK